MTISSYRACCYIDGFNLYYGMRENGWRDCYWLDVRKMCLRLIKKPWLLTRIKYFTARIKGAFPNDNAERAEEREASRARQLAYLEALATLPFVDIVEGKYFHKLDRCRNCRSESYRAEEKMTDVNIATELLTDAFLDRFDCALIISGDSDLVPPIQAIQTHFPNKRMVSVFPPKRHSAHLQQATNETLFLWRSTLLKSQLPDQVVKTGGIVLSRPSRWQ